MSPKTQACYDAIVAMTKEGYDKLAPALFSHSFGRAACSAAFRLAKQNGVIEIAYMSCVNTPVYRAAGVGAAMAEAATAIKH